MSGWGTAAGVGAGLMTGLQFMRQRQLDDQNKSYRDQALANQQEQLELQKQKSEQERFVFEQGKRQIELKDRSDQAFRDVQARPDLADPYDKQRAFAGELSKFGTKEQIDAAIQATQGMRQKFGPQIFSELKNGNTATVTRFLNENFPRTTVQVDGTAFKVIKPDGTVHSTVDMPALISMAGMADAYTAHREALQKERKVESEISKNNALELAALGRAGGATGGVGGSGKRSGKSETGAGLPFDTGDYEKYARTNPETGKTLPDSLANLSATAESIFKGNGALRDSPQAIMDIAARIDRGELKPEAVWDAKTNTYRKGVHYGSARVDLDTRAIDPMSFYAGSPEKLQQVVSNDKAWLERFSQSLPDDQRQALVSAATGDTPEGRSVRNQILDAVKQFQMAGQPIPEELAQKNQALLAGDRIKAMPVKTGKEPGREDESARQSKITEQDKATAKLLGIDLSERTPWDETKAWISKQAEWFSGMGARHDKNEFERLLRDVKERPDDRASRRFLLKRSIGNPERQARIQEELGNNSTSSR